MRKYRRNQLESGQAILLIAPMMIILLGLLGLALDGGGMFLLHRDAQNAVDAAAFAAAYSKCTGGDIEEIAYDVLGRNGFEVGTERVVEVVISSPPSDYTGADASSYVEVRLTAEKPAYFIQLVYRGPLTDTVRAVSRCQESYPSASRGTVVGLSTICQNTVDLSGSGIQITGAVASNESIKVSTSSGTIIGEGWFTSSYEGNENTLWTDDEKQVLIADDSYIGVGTTYSYADFDAGQWKPFNREYFPVYLPQQEEKLKQIIGEDWDRTIMYEKAIKKAQVEITANNQDVYAHFNLGTSFYALGRFEEAGAAFATAKQIGWPKRMLWYQIEPIQTLNEIGHYQEALNLANQALAANETFAEAHFEKARAFKGLNNIPQARFEAQSALNLAPDFAAAQEFLASL